MDVGLKDESPNKLLSLPDSLITEKQIIVFVGIKALASLL